MQTAIAGLTLTNPVVSCPYKSRIEKHSSGSKPRSSIHSLINLKVAAFWFLLFIYVALELGKMGEILNSMDLS